MKLFRAACLFFAGSAFLFSAISCAPEPSVGSRSSALPQWKTPTSAMLLTPSRVPVATTTPAPTSQSASPTECPNKKLTQYNVQATLDWNTLALHVTQQALFSNSGDQPLDNIVFALPMYPEADELTIERITLDKVEVTDFSKEISQLSIPLHAPLESMDEILLELEFSLVIPNISKGYRRGRLGYFGHSDQQINLGHWLPVIAHYDPSQGWIAPPPSAVGEPFVLPTANFSVRLDVQHTPDNLRVAGPGYVRRLDEHAWQFDLCGARELALSLSDSFGVLTTSTRSGIQVDLFYLNRDATTSLRAARHALNIATNALDTFEHRFGSYHYPRLVVVEGDFPDGMEFSGLVFVSNTWFRSWQGIPNDWLTLITAHEVAHQWWYAQVGNDQGQSPWLDEALATYCEILFVETYYPEYIEWWWEFRINSHQPAGTVDMPTTAFDAPRPYINTVYLTGAVMLSELRAALGDDVFFDWLLQYAQEFSFKIASPRDFWGALPPKAYAQTLPIRARYVAQDLISTAADTIP